MRDGLLRDVATTGEGGKNLPKINMGINYQQFYLSKTRFQRKYKPRSREMESYCYSNSSN